MLSVVGRVSSVHSPLPAGVFSPSGVLIGLPCAVTVFWIEPFVTSASVTVYVAVTSTASSTPRLAMTAWP